MKDGYGWTTYTYDALNRLTAVTDPFNRSLTYTYDALGRTGETVTDSSGTKTTTYTYDDADRLLQIAYADGKKTAYAYDGDQVITDRDGAGAVLAYYTRTPGGALLSATQASETYWYHTDGLGSVLALTKSDGTVANKYDYDEFGVLKSSTVGAYNNYKFAGAMHDAGPNLYQMGARYYNPDTGRFISQDAWGGEPYLPWTQHLYGYVGNNPVNFIDPTGMCAYGLECANDTVPGGAGDCGEEEAMP